jgi:hypothetical protein
MCALVRQSLFLKSLMLCGWNCIPFQWKMHLQICLLRVFFIRSLNDPQTFELLAGNACVDCHVASAAVIGRQISRHPALSFLLAGERHCIGLLGLQCLYQTLSLAPRSAVFTSWCVWPSVPGAFRTAPTALRGWFSCCHSRYVYN